MKKKKRKMMRGRKIRYDFYTLRFAEKTILHDV